MLLDRDGTLIVDHGYVGSVDRVDFIEGAPEAVSRLNRAGVPIALVTNQSGIARGLYGIKDVEAVHEHIASFLADKYGAHIDLFLYCPYHPDGVVGRYRRVSHSRKPRPGMAIAAAKALNLDLAQSWVVGDSVVDVGLAEAVGATALYVGAQPVNRPNVWSFPDFASAASFILEGVRA